MDVLLILRSERRNYMTSVNDAIKAAREAAAAQAAEAPKTYDLVPSEQSNAPAPAPVSYGKLTLDQAMTATGIANSVDNWLKVSEFGLNIGQDRSPLYESIKVQIDTRDEVGFFLKHSIKTAAGEYFSTYDGTTCDRGGLFSDAVAKVQRGDPTQVVYPAADIIMTLSEELKGKEKPHAAGTKLGHTTSRSNFQNFGEFLREVQKAGLMGTVVDATVGFTTVTSKKNGKTWGVLTFKLGH